MVYIIYFDLRIRHINFFYIFLDFICDCLYLSMTSYLYKSISFVFISLFLFTGSSYSNVEKDSVKIIRFERHIKSLDYISRKTSDNKQYLNLAKSYCDSILELDSNNVFAQKFKDKIELTLSANEFNMNHRIQLFELFNGFPDYMGFADDPIEYAYDDAIGSLLQSKEIDYQKGPIGDARFPSIIVRENCDDEMFEIANQIIIQNSSHYIIPPHRLESILGVDNAENLINGEVDKEYLELILKELNVETIGVFTMNDLDVIENSIWYVQSSFYAYKRNSGFTQTIFTRGFNHDKRNINLALIFLSLMGSLLLISIISFLDQFKKIKRTINDEITLLNKVKKSFELFVNKIVHVFTCFLIPLIFSFLMVYAVSNLIPESESDIREATSRIWLLTLTLGMSLFPTLINLILVNRLDLDGFHTIKGYRLFFNTSLYTTYFPIFVFYIIKFETFPIFEHFLLVIVTFTIAWLLSRSYYQFTSITIHKNLKIQAGIGLVFGIVSLVALNFFILSDLSYINLTYGFIIALIFSIIHSVIDRKVEQINSEKEKQSSEQSLIKSDIYLNEVFDPVKNIYEKIKLGMKNDDLDIMILSAPMGIGKTASLLKARELFKKNDEWDTYYGDCDEIQDEGAVSFEPFLEAFGKELNISQFSNRGEQIDSLKDSAVAAGSAVGVNTDILTDYQRDNQKTMTETCIEIIDRLEEKGNKLVFILEDLHFIDPETYSFLKHFIKIINNNPFLRKSICIILSLRNGQNEQFRGINEETLINDLAKINLEEDSPVEPETLYEYKDVNLKDFVKNLSNQDNSFKIQSYTMNQINDLFNNKLKENTDKFVLTPLYIKKTIEGWIEDDTLKYSPDGYLLSRTLSENDLPNSDDVDKYYHSIFDTYDEKWQRLLESAAIIGNRFDAEILAKVWGFEFLDILSFLEKAINDDLLEDLSAEDNMYEFKDKRIVTAIKSYFKTSTKGEGDKQIVIEYNKRYIALQEEIIKDPNKFSIEDVLKVARRLATLTASKQYKEQLQKLIVEISVRLAANKEFNKIRAFANFIESKGLRNISLIINVFSIVSDPDQDDNVQQNEIVKIHNYDESNESINLLEISTNDDFENELILIACLYYSPSRLSSKQFNYLINLVNKDYFSNKVSFEVRLILISDFKQRWEIFRAYDEVLDDLKSSRDIATYKLRIDILKIEEKRNFIKSKYNNTWSDKYPEPTIKELEKEYVLLGKKISKHNNLEITFQFLNSYIVFLSNQLLKNNEAINLFKKHISDFENDSIYIRQEIELKMLILTIYCRDVFIKNHKNLAYKYFDDVNSYFLKRFSKKFFNNFIRKFIEFKIMFFQETGNYKEMVKETKFQLEIIKNNWGEIKHGYAHACGKHADALRLSGKEKESIKWYEKRISIQKELLKEEDYTVLRTSYNNLAIDLINIKSKDYKKIKEYGKIALELASIDAPYYFHSLHTYACCLNYVGEFEESYKYYNKSMKYLKASTVDVKEERILIQNLQSALVLSKFDLQKAIPKLKIALNKMLKSKYSDQNKNEIKKAKKILKDNQK